ncbi:MAG: hypothetical protein J6X60_03270 [Ruminiclostridium sp.]|nr:hypothetical protein [Ruminiclostridium sp.]
MKRFIAGIVACVMILSGCTKATVTIEDKLQYSSNDTVVTSMFVMVEQAPYWFVVYNKDTKVMYAVSRESGNRGNFTLLVNPDGTPMIWKD